MLVINDERFIERAEIIREKGTNRSKFFRGEIDKYEWVDIGSSFLPSEVVAAFLYAQVENIDLIQQRRKHIWQTYYNNLKELEQTGLVQIPDIPAYATNNGSMFYMICSSLEVRTALISFLKERKIHAVFHYLSLHKSQYYHSKHDGRQLPNADRFSDCLVRLPFYFELTDAQLEVIIAAVREFIKNYAAVK
jgi:dTDP-4-amino-4,6-dideoxygalactose transaminase